MHFRCVTPGQRRRVWNTGLIPLSLVCTPPADVPSGRVQQPKQWRTSVHDGWRERSVRPCASGGRSGSSLAVSRVFLAFHVTLADCCSVNSQRQMYGGANLPVAVVVQGGQPGYAAPTAVPAGPGSGVWPPRDAHVSVCF